MTTRRLFSILACFTALVGISHASDDGGVPRPNRTAPVLMHAEPPDTAIVRLPGPPPEPPAAAADAGAPELAAVARAIKTADAPRPFLRRIKRDYPEGFEQDPARFLQQKIGQWKQFDVQELLDKPLRQRPSFDDDGNPNGVINAYSDPTAIYREYELDFAGDTGELRTVFVYPAKMTWQACRKVYGANVTSAGATQGRKFYSYLNRRMDVLVDAAGKVVSLGFY